MVEVYIAVTQIVFGFSAIACGIILGVSIDDKDAPKKVLCFLILFFAAMASWADAV